MLKEWTPYNTNTNTKENGSFLIITNLEKEYVIQYNNSINSLTKYKFDNIKTADPYYFHEYKDYKLIIRKIFELELLDTV